MPEDIFFSAFADIWYKEHTIVGADNGKTLHTL